MNKLTSLLKNNAQLSMLNYQLKHLIISVFAAALLIACTQPDIKQSQFIVSVSGVCVADIRLFDAAGNQIDRKYFDCQESKILIFTTQNNFGLLLFFAQSPENQQKIKQVEQIAEGQTKYININFNKI
jgi:hypothetical protein